MCDTIKLNDKYNTYEQQPLFELPFDGPSLSVPILLLMAILSSGSVSAGGEGEGEGDGEVGGERDNASGHGVSTIADLTKAGIAGGYYCLHNTLEAFTIYNYMAIPMVVKRS